jgi:hypothetical protein
MDVSVAILMLEELMSMKNSLPVVALLLLSTVALAGCEMIADIFKAGVWVGVVLVLAVIGLVVWIVSKSRT